MEREYSTPTAFDRAIKKAVRLPGVEHGGGYRQALRDRFLCRVFAGGNETFALKGGSGLLARIPEARATKDLDFATNEKCSSEDALAEMEKMGIEVVELPDAREKTIFCGPNGMRKIPKQDGGFTPKRYLEELPARGAFVAHDEEEIEPAMVEHFKDCPVDDVVTYCTACDAGVKMGKRTPCRCSTWSPVWSDGVGRGNNGHLQRNQAKIGRFLLQMSVFRSAMVKRRDVSNA